MRLIMLLVTIHLTFLLNPGASTTMPPTPVTWEDAASPLLRTQKSSISSRFHRAWDKRRELSVKFLLTE